MIRIRVFPLAFALCALAACSSNSTVTTGGATSSSGSAATGTTTTGGTTASSTTSGSSSGSSGSALPACSSCFDNTNCASGICSALGASDTVCLDACGSGCPSGTTCEQIPDSAGNPQQACVPNTGACGDPSLGACPPSGCSGTDYCNVNTATCVAATTTTTSGSSGSTGSGNCGNDLAPSSPDTTHACTCRATNPADCQANDCYGGWYCDTVAGRCVSQTTACGSTTTSTTGSTGTTSTSTSTSTTSTSGTTGTTGTTGSTAGAPWTGSVTQSGGSVDRLYFAAVGDSRPPSEDDVSNYPTAIISKIYQDMENLNPRPQFVVATGDYMFANPCGNTGAQQLDLYLNARNAFSGVMFPAMGNHECTGYTASNCLSSGSSNCSSSTTSASNNYAAFVSQLLQPIGQTKPYYRFDVNDSNGAWTAKFLVLAMNAWDSTQSSWLTTQLQQNTTYTFIIRHEPESATTAPGVSPSDSIISQYPYTMKIVGHTHEFYYYSGKQVIVGNGGAPLANTYSTYGYALIQMLADGNLLVEDYDYSSNAPTKTFTIPK